MEENFRAKIASIPFDETYLFECALGTHESRVLEFEKCQNHLFSTLHFSLKQGMDQKF